MDAVLRVERLDRIARVPAADPAVLGLVNLAGHPCPVLDVPALLGAAPPAPRRWAIVLGRRAAELALAADAVEIGRVPHEGVLPAAGGPPRLGLTADARVVLDAAALLGEEAAP
jgi:chemotaxis signal transduction protein